VKRIATGPSSSGSLQVEKTKEDEPPSDLVYTAMPVVNHQDFGHDDFQPAPDPEGFWNPPGGMDICNTYIPFGSPSHREFGNGQTGRLPEQHWSENFQYNDARTGSSYHYQCTTLCG
jgi:hypothetical protein